MNEYNYDFVVKMAEHFKALGQEKVWITDYRNYKNHPWDKATDLGGGCSYRLGIPTSVNFSLQHDGLLVEWSFELEDRDANGSGIYKFDRNRIKWVFDHLSPEMKKKFAFWLDTTVYAKAQELSNEIYENYKKNRDTETFIAELVEYGKKQ